MAWVRVCTICLAASLLVSAGSCSRGRSPNSIKITGSDTMVNLAQAWQEFYLGVRPEVIIQVKGGGSGVGLAALCSGKVEIAPSSRKIKPKEIELAVERTGRVPKEFIVGLDALAIYVHKDNPLEEITLPQLAGIYGEGGDIEQWSQLGVDNSECRDGEIIRVSRQNSSGTYVYFREAILGKTGDFKLGATSQSGSSDVVALITHTPCAIGYSGMGYRTDGVKMVRVAKKKGDKAISPSAESALNGTYPISRPLFLYMLGEPEGAVKDFIDWTLSPTGQRIVAEVGYVPKEKQHGA